MKTNNLQRVVGKWRRKRERTKKLEPAPQPAPRPAEIREGTVPTPDPTP